MPRTTAVQTASTEREGSGVRHWTSRLRSYFIWGPLIYLYTFVLGCLSLLSSFLDRDGRVQHSFARLWSRMILATIGVPVHVEGLEKIDTRKAHVYAVNHLSALDVPLLYACLPFQFRILAKKELFRYPFMGWHLRRSGQIPIDRENARSSLHSMNRAAKSLRNNMPILVFPEGGRSRDGQLGEFMSGASYTAIKAQADIVPMAIAGTYDTLPMNTWHIRPHPFYLLVGNPISTCGMNVRQMDSVTQKTRDAIAQLHVSHDRKQAPDKGCTT